MRRRMTAFALLVAFFNAAPALAGSMELYPVRIDLAAERPSATMKVRNTGAERMTVEVRTAAWAQDGGADAYQPTRAVLASPPVFELPPGAEQVVRVGLVEHTAGGRTAGGVEGAYRIFLQELPEPAAHRGEAVRTLLRVGVPVFVNTAGGAAPALGWAARREGGALVLEARNTGTAHARIHALSVASAGAPPRPLEGLGGYVLPGATRRFVVQANRVPGSTRTIDIEAQTSHGPSRETVPIR
ncbi:fimbrial biogenesis chaperone [Azospirillum sp.]|uniref:fimbrial biogenesis chaperone n=1 Tax=Azospirillum sp. TaxID=34012 RepID=UPI002D756F72|nr:fimbria/pilus periplasmic chaperone [Azospirillum sp.]HYD70654.1 fimbria/pilus periplasmic chaperone [Azospirillum sp.]